RSITAATSRKKWRPNMVQNAENEPKSKQSKGNGQKENRSLATQGRPGSSSQSIMPRDVSGRGGLARARSPFALMSQLSQEMERVFEGFWGAPFGHAPASWGGSDTGETGAELWAPAVEVHQHDGEIIVRADLPGMKKE